MTPTAFEGVSETIHFKLCYCAYFGKQCNVFRFLMTDNDMTFSVFPYSYTLQWSMEGITMYVPHHVNAYTHYTETSR